MILVAKESRIENVQKIGVRVALTFPTLSVVSCGLSSGLAGGRGCLFLGSALLGQNRVSFFLTLLILFTVRTNLNHVFFSSLFNHVMQRDRGRPHDGEGGGGPGEGQVRPD